MQPNQAKLSAFLANARKAAQAQQAQGIKPKEPAKQPVRVIIKEVKEVKKKENTEIKKEIPKTPAAEEKKPELSQSKTGKTVKIGNSAFELVSQDHEFVFQCKNCGVCCRKVSVMLNPFDIMQLCAKLKAKTFQVHKLTKFRIDKKTNLPVCFLNTDPQCGFLSKDKRCLVYNERPFRCRGYPIGVHRAQPAQPEEYFLYHMPGCSANKLKQGESIGKNKISVRQSLKKDEFVKYQKYENDWKKATAEISKDYKPTNENHQKFIKICYDFDSKVFKKMTGKSLPKEPDKKFQFIIELAKKEFLSINS